MSTRFRAELVDFLQFVRRPSLGPRLPRAAESAWRSEWLGGMRLGRLFCWVLLLWTVNLMVLGPVAASAASMVGAERRYPTMLPWLLVVGWAPFIEEMVFRFGLRRPNMAVWLLPILLVGLFFGRNPTVAISVIVALILTGAALARRGHRLPWAQRRRYHRRFPYVFYVCTFAFAALHLANYNLTTIAPWLVPLMILPQLVTGTVLGWWRVRFGIGASIMLQIGRAHV